MSRHTPAQFVIDRSATRRRSVSRETVAVVAGLLVVVTSFAGGYLVALALHGF